MEQALEFSEGELAFGASGAANISFESAIKSSTDSN